MKEKVAIIGAGVAGSICARDLAEAGFTVSVFDKGRSVGGRLAQRRRDGAIFDHGAQFVRPRAPVLVSLLEGGIEAGVVARWPEAEADGRPVYVGRPAMATPFKHLLAELPVETDCRIEKLRRTGEGWWLDAADGVGHGPFDAVVVAIPAPQARELLATAGSIVPESLLVATKRAVMAPCWALLLAFDPPLDLRGFDARPIDGGPLSWLARNTTKPGREGLDSWTVHASADWSTEHLEKTPDQVIPPLLAAFREVTGTGSVEPVYMAAHRWRHALVTTPVGEPALYDQASGLGLCGDWCLGGKIEAAFESGRALAKLIRN